MSIRFERNARFVRFAASAVFAAAAIAGLLVVPGRGSADPAPKHAPVAATPPAQAAASEDNRAEARPARKVRVIELYNIPPEQRQAQTRM